MFTSFSRVERVTDFLKESFRTKTPFIRYTIALLLLVLLLLTNGCHVTNCGMLLKKWIVNGVTLKKITTRQRFYAKFFILMSGMLEMVHFMMAWIFLQNASISIIKRLYYMKSHINVFNVMITSDVRSHAVNKPSLFWNKILIQEKFLLFIFDSSIEWIPLWYIFENSCRKSCNFFLPKVSVRSHVSFILHSFHVIFGWNIWEQ